MIDGIKLEDGPYGLCAVATSGWSKRLTDYVSNKLVVELELNHAKGWKRDDLHFLSELPNLLSIKVIDLNISSVEPVHLLHNLRSLKLTTYCQTELRFSAFSLLEDCSLEWRPKANSLFECATLKRLFINRYSGANVDAFSKLVRLESLGLLNAPVKNLAGLQGLKSLKYLRLGNLSRLTSLAGIEGLTDLEELDINTCRAIESIDEIAHLPRLRKLCLNNSGVIRSLKPLEKLRQLELVVFYESTNILDGDLSPLLLQENLGRVAFKNRRHYSHGREAFGAG